MWNRNIMLFLCAYVYVHACAEPLLPSQTLRHCGLQPARPLCPWDSPGKNTAVGCRASTRDLPDPGVKPTSHVSCIGRWVLYHQHHLRSSYVYVHIFKDWNISSLKYACSTKFKISLYNMLYIGESLFHRSFGLVLYQYFTVLIQTFFWWALINMYSESSCLNPLRCSSSLLHQS